MEPGRVRKPDGAARGRTHREEIAIRVCEPSQPVNILHIGAEFYEPAPIDCNFVSPCHQSTEVVPFPGGEFAVQWRVDFNGCKPVP